MKRLIKLATVSSLLLCMVVPVMTYDEDIQLTQNSNTEYDASTTPPTDIHVLSDGVEEYGSSNPGPFGPVHDVKTQGAYSYDVIEVVNSVYTNEWLTGSSSYTVYINHFNNFENWGGPNDELTVGIYDAQGVARGAKTL